jgi:hypothetical protein
VSRCLVAEKLRLLLTFVVLTRGGPSLRYGVAVVGPAETAGWGDCRGTSRPHRSTHRRFPRSSNDNASTMATLTRCGGTATTPPFAWPLRSRQSQVAELLKRLGPEYPELETTARNIKHQQPTFEQHSIQLSPTIQTRPRTASPTEHSVLKTPAAKPTENFIVAKVRSRRRRPRRLQPRSTQQRNNAVSTSPEFVSAGCAISIDSASGLGLSRP